MMEITQAVTQLEEAVEDAGKYRRLCLLLRNLVSVDPEKFANVILLMSTVDTIKDTEVLLLATRMAIRDEIGKRYLTGL